MALRIGAENLSLNEMDGTAVTDQQAVLSYSQTVKTAIEQELAATWAEMDPKTPSNEAARIIL